MFVVFALDRWVTASGLFVRTYFLVNKIVTFIRRDVTVACSAECRILLKGKVRFPATSADKATLWHAISKTGHALREFLTSAVQ